MKLEKLVYEMVRYFADDKEAREAIKRNLPESPKPFESYLSLRNEWIKKVIDKAYVIKGTNSLAICLTKEELKADNEFYQNVIDRNYCKLDENVYMFLNDKIILIVNEDI